MTSYGHIRRIRLSSSVLGDIREGEHEKDAGDSAAGGDDKPWLDPNRDPTQLVGKSDNILLLEAHIEKTQDKIEDSKDIEERKRKEFQVHMQHWRDVTAYIENRRQELLIPTNHVTELLMLHIPQCDKLTKDHERRRRKTMAKFGMIMRTFHTQSTAHLAFQLLRNHADYRKMMSFMEKAIKDLMERTRRKEMFFKGLDELVTKKEAVKMRLVQKCRDTAWGRISKYGVAK